MRLSSSTYIVFILIFTLQGCITAPKSKHGYSAKEIEALEQEISFEIEPERQRYFEGQEIWIKIRPRVRQAVDSVLSAAGLRPGRSLYGDELPGQIRVFHGKEEITKQLRAPVDYPDLPSVKISGSSILLLQQSSYFMHAGNYSLFLDAGVQSNKIDLHIAETPDSLFAVRFVLLADVGFEHTMNSPPHGYLVYSSARLAWRVYADRLLSLPHGYPYRSEGLRIAAGEYLKFRDEFEARDSVYARSVLVEWAKEQPQRYFFVSHHICNTWLRDADSLTAKNEVLWFSANVGDSPFTTELEQAHIKATRFKRQ